MTLLLLEMASWGSRPIVAPPGFGAMPNSDRLGSVNFAENLAGNLDSRYILDLCFKLAFLLIVSLSAVASHFEIITPAMSFHHLGCFTSRFPSFPSLLQHLPSVNLIPNAESHLKQFTQPHFITHRFLFRQSLPMDRCLLRPGSTHTRYTLLYHPTSVLHLSNYLLNTKHV